MKKLIFFSLLILIHPVNSCRLKYRICTGLSDSFPINDKKIELKESIGLGGEVKAFFNPLFLPIKLVYSSDAGFSVLNEGEAAILTPLGTVGIEYAVGTQEEKTINGHKVTGGDFVVGLVDRKKGENHLFKIEGYSRLKVVASGKTRIDAQSGYVEIDITEAKVQELTFIDSSRISIVNTTNEPLEFIFSVLDLTGSEMEYVCTIEPNSYKYYPRFEFVKPLNSSFDSEYSVKVIVDDVKNSLSTTLARKVDFGDACHIIKREDAYELKKREIVSAKQ